uniref:SRCR domain-containing protein n=1 Tax=Neogobius melanostomus TaxID=47308 RepID=A0A8C6WG82_9GOBI
MMTHLIPSSRLFVQTRCGWSGGGACVQDLCRSRTSPWPSPGPGSVRGLGPSRGRGAVQGAGLWAPLLQGALSPLGQTFQCEGNESKLMDCPRTRTGPETCPTLNLTCKEPLRLVGGASRCEGTVEAELRGEWRRVVPYDLWDLEAAAAVCRDLDCGSPVSTEQRDESDKSKVWSVYTYCVKKQSSVRDCVSDHDSSYSRLQVICSDLLNVPEVSVSEGVWAPRAEGELFGPRAQEGDWASPGEGGVWVQMGHISGSNAPWSRSTREAPSSCSLPLSTSPCRPSITPPTSCLLT